MSKENMNFGLTKFAEDAAAHPSWDPTSYMDHQEPKFEEPATFDVPSHRQSVGDFGGSMEFNTDFEKIFGKQD